MGQLTFEPLIPGALWLVLATVAAALLLWHALRRPAAISRRRWAIVVALMTSGLAIVLALLLNPTWSRELPPPAGKPVLTVLVDDSGSMNTPDAAGGITRFAAAGKVAGELASSLGDRFEVRVRRFDQTVRAATPEWFTSAVADGSGTDLSTAIGSSLTEEHPQGQAMVVLSDGIDNAGGGAAAVLNAVRTAKAMAAPIYTRTFGGEVRSIDLAAEIPAQQDLAVVGQKVPLAVRVTHVGITSGKAFVTLLQDGKEVARREAILSPDAASDVHFLLSQDKAGVYPYEARVEPLPGETSQANNSAAYVLRVVNEPIRVLVLEGKPYWDSKFLTRTLMADPAVALDCVVRLADQRLLRRTLSHERAPATQSTSSGAGEQDAESEQRVETWHVDTDAAAVLASAERLRNYQVIVIGRDAEPFLSGPAVATLENWVAQQGGSLVCYRGSPTSTSSQALAKLLPVRWSAGAASRFRVEMTERGKDLNWFGGIGDTGDALSRLPSLVSASAVQTAKPLAVVLASAVVAGSPPSPAVIYQPYGSGRVAVVEGAGMWRWAFLSPQYQDQDVVYGSLWHSLVRWLSSGQGLSPGQRYSLRGDKVRFGADEPATATLLAREESGRSHLPMVELTADGSEELKRYAPAALGSEAGVYRVNFGLLPEGRYHAKMEKRETADASAQDVSTQIVFDVRRYDQESLDLQSRPDLMARIATDSGGAVLGESAASDVSRQFAQHLAQFMPPRVERSSAWDRWWILCLVILWWGASWAVRRSGGLI